MRPIHRTFVVPSKNIRRVGLPMPMDRRADLDAHHAFSEAEYEVREMDGRLGRIEWRDSIREFERAFEDTCPSQLE